MKFITEVLKKDYISFYNKSKYSTILQSYAWGEFCREGKGQTPFYVGVVDSKDKLIATSLLLKKDLPLGYSLFYAPRGFNLDFSNKELLTFFTKEIKAFLKVHKAVALTIDPEVIYQADDGIHESLQELGYKHTGFNKNYENNQPRYTFIIDLKDNYIDKMSKSFLKNIDKSKKYDLEFYVGSKDDLKYFNELYAKTALRDDFFGYGDAYYNHFYEVFNEVKMGEIFLCKLYPKRIINTLNLEMKEISDELKIVKNPNKLDSLLKRQEKVFKELEFFNNYKDNTEGIVVSAHIMAFYQDKAVALYAGNDKDFASTYANNYVYYEKIKWAKDNGYNSLDLFGVTGDPNSKHKNLAGIYEFKKSLGGNLIEFIGEYDLIINPLFYVMKGLLPVYHKLKKMIKR